MLEDLVEKVSYISLVHIPLVHLALSDLWYKHAVLVYAFFPFVTGGMVSKKYNDPLDSTAFVMGLVTLLKQYHSEITEQFLSVLGQYVRSMVDANVSK